VDTQWFKEIMRALNVSQSEVARAVQTRLGRSFDKSMLSKIIWGQRIIRTDEIAPMAEVLGVSYEELVQRLGYDIPRESTQKTPVVGWVRPDHIIRSRGKAPGPYKSKRVPRPAGMPDLARAVRMVAEGTHMDGWVFYYLPTADLRPSAVGRLAVVQAKGSSNCYLCVLTRGDRMGRWHLKSPWSSSTEPFARDVLVASAAPVEWIRTE